MIEEKACPGCFKIHGRRVPVAAWLADCPWCGYRFIVGPQVHQKPKPLPVSGVLKDGTRWDNLRLFPA